MEVVASPVPERNGTKEELKADGISGTGDLLLLAQTNMDELLSE